ncbi:MAG TPA: hypothetical protein P5290_04900 [Candidatus Methanomethylicus sp.]|nr:hypothetical protein [Candidatus Methanomethylicus sp.]
MVRAASLNALRIHATLDSGSLVAFGVRWPFIKDTCIKCPRSCVTFRPGQCSHIH